MNGSAIDLLAVRAGHPPLLVQCRTSLYVIPSERIALPEAADVPGGVALVAGVDDGRLVWRRFTGPGSRVVSRSF